MRLLSRNGPPTTEVATPSLEGVSSRSWEMSIDPILGMRGNAKSSGMPLTTSITMYVIPREAQARWTLGTGTEVCLAT